MALCDERGNYLGRGWSGSKGGRHNLVCKKLVKFRILAYWRIEAASGPWNEISNKLDKSIEMQWISSMDMRGIISALQQAFEEDRGSRNSYKNPRIEEALVQLSAVSLWAGNVLFVWWGLLSTSSSTDCCCQWLFLPFLPGLATQRAPCCNATAAAAGSTVGSPRPISLLIVDTFVLW